jgi:hypothetical protein
VIPEQISTPAVQENRMRRVVGDQWPREAIRPAGAQDTRRPATIGSAGAQAAWRHWPVEPAGAQDAGRYWPVDVLGQTSDDAHEEAEQWHGAQWRAQTG